MGSVADSSYSQRCHPQLALPAWNWAGAGDDGSKDTETSVLTCSFLLTNVGQLSSTDPPLEMREVRVRARYGADVVNAKDLQARGTVKGPIIVKKKGDAGLLFG